MQGAYFNNNILLNRESHIHVFENKHYIQSLNTLVYSRSYAHIQLKVMSYNNYSINIQNCIFLLRKIYITMAPLVIFSAKSDNNFLIFYSYVHNQNVY